MSEQITFNHENNEIPTSSQVLDAFAARREELNVALNELKNNPGFKMNGDEKVYHDRDLKAANGNLEVFNEEYFAMGGAEIDDAQQAVDALNFKSDAEDHVRAKARLTAAKTAFYENFLATEEVGRIENEMSTHEDVIDNMPAATVDPTNIKPNKEVSGNNSEDDETPKKSVRLPIPKINLPNIEEEIAKPKVAVKLPIPKINAESLDADTLDADESKNDVNEQARLGQRIRGAYLRAAAMFANRGVLSSSETTPERTFREENGRVVEDTKDQEKRRRFSKKAIGAFAAGVAGVGLAVYAYRNGLPGLSGNHLGDIPSNDILPQQGSGASSSQTAAEIAGAHPGITGSQEIIDPSTFNIPKGSGGEALLGRMGVPKDVWYENQDKFLKLFPKEGYRMSDGNVGFTKPGQLSKSAAEFWLKASGKS